MQRTDFIPTSKQVERGLTDEDCGVREVCAEREDFIPTNEQVERGLKDVAEVSLVWIHKLRSFSEETVHIDDELTTSI
jgi:hypothetical protein